MPQDRALDGNFGVPASFSDYDDKHANLLRAQVQLLALIHDSNITAAQLRSLLELSPEALQAVADLVRRTAGSDAHHQRSNSQSTTPSGSVGPVCGCGG